MVGTDVGAINTGRAVFRDDVRFNGVKVFSATMYADREKLGEKVSDWIAQHPKAKVTEIDVTQSSDAAFHCITLSLFYWEPLAPR